MEEHQRARILEVAIDVFAEKGYPTTAVGDLVNAAQVGVGSFYALFGGKEGCLIAAYETVVGEARAEAVSMTASADGWAARAARGLRALLEWVQREPARARIALVEIQTGGEPALRAHREVLAAVSGFLRQGRTCPAVARPLPETLEHSTVSGIAWLLHGLLSAGETVSFDSLFRDLGELVLEPYLGEQGARQELARALPPERPEPVGP
jgi:AcrR family transcriptional regulator